MNIIAHQAALIKELWKTEYQSKFNSDSQQFIFLHKNVRHFIERCVTRFNMNQYDIEKIVKAFFGMLLIRKDSYVKLAQSDRGTEQRYIWGNGIIIFDVYQTHTPCVNDENGTNIMILLKTYTPVTKTKYKK